jgi:endonuclease/exonuclease/phosphatase (EEP) superfamily protein YafD
MSDKKAHTHTAGLGQFISAQLRFRGLVTAAGSLASFATVSAFWGRYHWLLDLCAHFRAQYAWGLIVCALLLLCMPKRKVAIGFLVVAAINLLVILPLYLRPSHSNSSLDQDPIRIMLINVNTQRGDPQKIRDAIETTNPDILVLLEINTRWLQQLTWLQQHYDYSRTQPRVDNFGIGLYTRLPMKNAKVVSIGDVDIPSIIADLEVSGTNLHVIATHPVPPVGAEYSMWRNAQLQALPQYIPNHQPVLLVGDLNTTPWSYHFKTLLRESGLRNSAKGFGIQPTWPTHNPLLRIPIDHCLHSNNIFIQNRTIGPNVSSDHYPLVVDLMITE